MTDIANSKLVTLSVWVNPANLDANIHILSGAGGSSGVRVRLRSGTEDVEIEGRGGVSGNVILRASTANASIVAGVWQHIHVFADMANVANRGVFLNGVEATGITWGTYTDEVLDFEETDHAVGALANGSSKFIGDMAELWYAPGQYEDDTTKFIAAGAPVDLGADGSTPTTVAPILFLSGATDAWHTNKGTGGGMTENGALTDGTGPVEVA